ncbi:glutamate synthase [Lewinellaceae bacterium SD302]|nr:glutamate synthase [Lewinellaceae bacterium SD302]
MNNPQGFLTHTRQLPTLRPVEERVNDYNELYIELPVQQTVEQASRCMDCGVPFCHSGCPLGNIIPEFNEAVYEEDWRMAYQILSSTNNFPEFTGRICPAPCEAACVLGINQPPVAIEHIEKSIVEKAFELGYVRPQPPVNRTGKRVAVVGSGPAGLAAAAQLNRAGHTVTVYEKNTRIGGLLRYGIPDFKLEKWVIDRRLKVMEAEGVYFAVNAEVGGNVDAWKLVNEQDAVILAGGSSVPRDIPKPGRELKGIHFAMDFLEQNNKRVAGDQPGKDPEITAKGKKVIVIGGGDTGADCVGTSNRHGAVSVTQLEIMEMPPSERHPDNWPNWPMILRTSTSHEEGCERDWSVLTEAFVGNQAGEITAIRTVKIKWSTDELGNRRFAKIAGSEAEIECDLLLIAAGFTNPKLEGLLDNLGLELERNHIKTPQDSYQTSLGKVFTAGDMRRGASLVVWAISEGRECAREVDKYLMGTKASVLEGKQVGRGVLVAES